MKKGTKVKLTILDDLIIDYLKIGQTGIVLVVSKVPDVKIPLAAVKFKGKSHWVVLHQPQLKEI